MGRGAVGHKENCITPDPTPVVSWCATGHITYAGRATGQRRVRVPTSNMAATTENSHCESRPFNHAYTNVKARLRNGSRYGLSEF